MDEVMRPRMQLNAWRPAGPRRPTLVARERPADAGLTRRPEPAGPSFRDMTSRMSTLERAPVFFAFRESELRAIARRLRRLQVPAGEIIVCQGEPGDSIFFIERGRCRVVVEKSPSLVTVSVLSEGEFFGEGACLLGRPQQASVYAQTDCHLLALDMPNLNAVLSSREEYGTEEIKRFAEQRFKLFADISVQATWGQLLQEATVVGVYSPKGGSGGTCI